MRLGSNSAETGCSPSALLLPNSRNAALSSMSMWSSANTHIDRLSPSPFLLEALGRTKVVSGGPSELKLSEPGQLSRQGGSSIGRNSGPKYVRQSVFMLPPVGPLLYSIPPAYTVQRTPSQTQNPLKGPHHTPPANPLLISSNCVLPVLSKYRIFVVSLTCLLRSNSSRAKAFISVLVGEALGILFVARTMSRHSESTRCRRRKSERERRGTLEVARAQVMGVVERWRIVLGGEGRGRIYGAYEIRGGKTEDD